MTLPQLVASLMPPLLLVVLCTALFASLRSALRWKARFCGFPLPPGPQGLPIIGNVFDVPRYKPWIGFRDMSRKYGEIVHLRVLGRSMVVLGSASVVTEYLDKRSKNSADRGQSLVVELSGQQVNFAVHRYGSWWRRHRRMFWQHFHPGAVDKYSSIQRTHAHRFLSRLLQSPAQVTENIRLSLAGIILQLAYGIKIADEGDENMRMIDAAFVAIEQATPGHFAVDIFPFLRHLPAWFPGAGFQKAFARCKAASDHLKTVPFNAVRKAMANGEVRDCLAVKLLARAGPDLGPEEEEILQNTCTVALEGGTDTTASALSAFFVAMALHPEVQKKAQKELDTVVGPHRLPEDSDRPALVYIDALIKELLRWHLVVPLCITHYTLEDDEFNGYFIPAGSEIIPNVWDIMHDPEVYECPDEFRPERFIRDGKLDPSVRDPNAFIFGFGRRFCPGRYFALASLFIHVAFVLHVFDISPPLDDAGQPIKLEYRQGHGLLSKPKDCRCTIKPRSPEAVELIVQAQRMDSTSA